MQQQVDTRDFLSQTKFYEGYSRFKEDDIDMKLGMRLLIVLSICTTKIILITIMN